MPETAGREQEPMTKNRLAEWTSIAEIIAAVSVVVSLLFVGYSINQNTAAIEASEESAFLESWRNLTQLPFYADAELAAIQLKVHTGEALTPIESKRWENYLRAVFDTWWQLHNSYRDGLISDEAWHDLNGAVLTLWDLERMGAFWAERGRHWAGTPFGDHINTEVQRMGKETSSE
jgi:hypothetical protein